MLIIEPNSGLVTLWSIEIITAARDYCSRAALRSIAALLDSNGINSLE
jgi:hypothetical protein